MDKSSSDNAAAPDLNNRAYTLATAGRLEEAQSLYERLCDIDPADAESRYNLGTVLKGRRLYAQAEAAFRDALRLKPDYPEALHNLGIILTELNRLDEAADCYEKALNLAPAAPSHYNLGNLYLRRRQYEPAAEQFRRALALAPGQAEAHARLGATLGYLARYDEAEAALGEALRLKPDLAAAHGNLAAVLSAQQRHGEAVAHYRDALRLAPGATAHYRLASALARQLENDEAIEHYRQVLSLAPDHTDALNDLGNVYRQQGRYCLAEECYRRVLDINPDYLQAHINLGAVLLDTGRPAEALASYRRVLELAPETRKAVIGEANAHEKLGDIERARSLLQPFIDAGDIDPDVALAFCALCRPLGRCGEAAALVRELLERRGESMDAHDRCLLHFALGRLLDAAADYTGAFAHFSRGNALADQYFDPDRHRRYVDELISTYSAAFMNHAPRARNSSRRPVFIVGMLRSGTSLVEQILATHPDVCGAGELEEVDHIAAELPGLLGAADDPYPGCVSRLTEDLCEQLAARYLAHLSTRCPGDTARVTDKMPGNFLHLGLIAQLFPRARIIHCMRDPLDTCLSCFFQHFGRGLSYTNSLTHVGLFYREYRRLMAHWKTVIDLPVLEVRYEDLVSSQEPVTRTLLEFCGLNWDPRCLRFHESRRVVATASYDQVRQPLYDRSVGRWRHYQRELAPLTAALGDILDNAPDDDG